MKKRATILIGMVLFFLFSIVILEFVLAEKSEMGIKLNKGRNYLEINQTLYVNELVLLNPAIESVSYFDEFLNQSIGYVNILGGVGSNFLIKQEQIYEISVSKNTSLVVYHTP